VKTIIHTRTPDLPIYTCPFSQPIGRQCSDETPLTSPFPITPNIRNSIASGVSTPVITKFGNALLLRLSFDPGVLGSLVRLLWRELKAIVRYAPARTIDDVAPEIVSDKVCTLALISNRSHSSGIIKL